ncbi:AMIN domain-containing protein, partial [bacterium]|nr:AMIN domain-containing protein [bacterium]
MMIVNPKIGGMMNKSIKGLMIILGLFISFLFILAQEAQSRPPEQPSAARGELRPAGREASLAFRGSQITNRELKDLPQVARALEKTKEEKEAKKRESARKALEEQRAKEKARKWESEKKKIEEKLARQKKVEEKQLKAERKAKLKAEKKRVKELEREKKAEEKEKARRTAKQLRAKQLAEKRAREEDKKRIKDEKATAAEALKERERREKTASAAARKEKETKKRESARKSLEEQRAREKAGKRENEKKKREEELARQKKVEEKQASQKSREERERKEKAQKEVEEKRLKAETKAKKKAQVAAEQRRKEMARKAARQQWAREEEARKERERRIEGYYAAGRHLYKEGKYQEAIGEFGKVLKIAPEEARAQKYIATAKAQKEKERRKEKKERIEELYVQGKELYEENKFKEARLKFKEILAVATEHKEANKYLAKIQNKLAKIPEEKALYQIEDVEVSELLDQTRVTIISNEQLKYSSFALSEPPRLIIDFPDACLEWEEKELVVEKGVLSKIRSGQFSAEPPIIRIFLDLNQMVKYDIVQKDNRITVALVHPIEAKPEEKVKLPPAEPEAKPEAPLLLSLDYKAAELSNVLRALSYSYDLNLVVTKDIKGKVTLSLKDVTIDEALEAILMVNGYTHTRRKKLIYIIPGPGLEGIATNSVVTPLKHLTASEAHDLLQKVISSKGDIRISEATNSLVITDFPANIDKVNRLLKEIDTPPLQVLIEARIVEIGSKDLQNIGINYTVDYKGVGIGHRGSWYTHTDEVAGTIDMSGPSASLSGGQFEITKLSTRTVDINATIDALIQDQKAHLLASPSIATLNGKEARIIIGEKYPYKEKTQTTTGTTETTKFVDVGTTLR